MVVSFSRLNDGVWRPLLKSGAILVVLCLCACTAKNSTLEGESLAGNGRGAVQAENKAPVVVRPGDTFAWHPNGRFFFDAPRFRGDSVRDMLEQTIVDVLAKKGLRRSSSSGESTFFVGYTVVLGGQVGPEDMALLNEREPELKYHGADPSQYEKGMLTIVVMDSKNLRPVWSDAVHGFTQFEMPADVRMRRLRAAVEQVMASFPGVNN